MKKVKKTVRWQENKLLTGAVILVIFLGLLIIFNQYLTQRVSIKGAYTVAEISETLETPPSASNQLNGGPQFSNRALTEIEFFAIPANQADFDDLSFTASPDGQHFAYVFEKNGKASVVLNGSAGASYDAITFMRFSPDGARFAYGAKLNGKEMVVLDGKEGKLYDWIFEPRFFTADSRYFFYKARTDQGEIMVFNNNESRAYEKIYSTFMSADKSQLIYYGRSGDKIWRASVSLNKVKE